MPPVAQGRSGGEQRPARRSPPDLPPAGPGRDPRPAPSSLPPPRRGRINLSKPPPLFFFFLVRTPCCRGLPGPARPCRTPLGPEITPQTGEPLAADEGAAAAERGRGSPFPSRGERRSGHLRTQTRSLPAAPAGLPAGRLAGPGAQEGLHGRAALAASQGPDAVRQRRRSAAGPTETEGGKRGEEGEAASPRPSAARPRSPPRRPPRAVSVRTDRPGRRRRGEQGNGRTAAAAGAAWEDPLSPLFAVNSAKPKLAGGCVCVPGAEPRGEPGLSLSLTPRVGTYGLFLVTFILTGSFLLSPPPSWRRREDFFFFS